TPSSANNGSTIDDAANIQPELAAQIQAKHLPAPDANTLYVVFFRKGQVVSLMGSDSKSGFCAYHNTVDTRFPEAYYAVIPWQDPTDPGCQYASTSFDSITAIVGHELVEAVTDPEVGRAPDFGPPLGWYDAVNSAEIADACATNSTFTAGDGTNYVAENAWSNSHGTCIGAGPQSPGPPTGVSAVAGPGTATLSWNAAGANGSAIAQYIVTSPATQPFTVSGTARSATIGNLVGGRAYTFTVSARDTFGDSTPSEPVTITIGLAPPGPPTSVSATAGTARAAVSWRAAAPNGAPVTSYTVTASPGGATVVVPGSRLNATVNGLTPGVAYRFHVAATNVAGQGPPAASNLVVVLAVVHRAGYWMLSSDGHVYSFGAAPRLGDTSGPVVAIATRTDGLGYWTTDGRGNVRAFGAAANHGGRPPLRPGEQVSTISATPSGSGYLLFTDEGSAFAYGDAHLYGDMRNVRLQGRIIASTATATGRGYYMVGSDGGVFAFGDARFRGSMGGVRLNKPVVGIAASPDNRGYWLVASDGGVFAFHAPFRGSMGGVRLNRPIIALVAYGNGYLMVGSDGGIFDFADTPFVGSLGDNPPPAPIVSVAAFVS
ncbi:MAG TPA: fibronectin type III domain-containing protein, partial [Acidimicrobiia bacterium]|nr:fibronectin type III domain-containing protein [Acidimicrobiia bacterium]